jgi:hypothetical protein
MATVQATNRLALKTRVRKAVAVQKPGIPGTSHSLSRQLAYEGRSLLGAGLLCLGILLTFTLWLLPLGLPVALLGTALISAPGD